MTLLIGRGEVGRGIPWGALTPVVATRRPLPLWSGDRERYGCSGTGGKPLPWLGRSDHAWMLMLRTERVDTQVYVLVRHGRSFLLRRPGCWTHVDSRLNHQ